MLCTLSGNLIPIARPPCKHPVDSFNFGWQVWTKYEMEIVPFSHKRNHKRRRAAHRNPRLTAHRQSTHGNCRSGSPPQARTTATYINESCVTSVRPTSELTCVKLVGGTTPRPIAHVLPEIKLPFNLETWRECLRTHPDTDFVIDLLHDIEVGVHIGYQPATCAFQTCHNHLFARTNPGPVARENERELELNRKVGPFLAPPFQHFTGSPLGTIPKKHSDPVKWRIIHDLSWPTGLSINNGIPEDLFSCNYDSLDYAITLVKHFGPGAVVSKLPNNSSSASLILTVLLPYQHRTLILFVTSLAAQIKPQSINVYLDGVHSLHVSNGYNNPLTPGLQQTRCGIVRNNFAAPKQKMPVTFDILCKIHPFMNFHSNDDIVYNYLWPFLVIACWGVHVMQQGAL